MIKYDEAGDRFCDGATGNSVIFKQPHPRELFFDARHSGSAGEFRFSLEVVKLADGQMTVGVRRSYFLHPAKAYWLPFGGLDGLVAGLKPYVDAWAKQNWRAFDSVRIELRDDRPKEDEPLEYALASPNVESLYALKGAYAPRRPT